MCEPVSSGASLKSLADLLRESENPSVEEVSVFVEDILRLHDAAPQQLGDILDIRSRISLILPERQEALVVQLNALAGSIFPQAKDKIDVPRTFYCRLKGLVGHFFPNLLDKVDQALFHLRTIDDEQLKKNLLEALEGILDERRVETVLFFRDFEDKGISADILRALILVPKEHRGETLEPALSLFQGFLEGAKFQGFLEGTKILQALEKVSPDRRADALKYTALFIKKNAGVSKIASILSALEKFPPDERADVTNQVAPLIPDPLDGEAWAIILNAVSLIPPDQRLDVINHTQPLLKGTHRAPLRADFLRAVGMIPKERRASVMESIAFLLVEIDDRCQRNLILDAIDAIPADERANAINQALPFVRDIKNGGIRADLLRAVSLIPQKERTTDTIKSIVSLFRNVQTGFQRVAFLREINKIPPADRVATLNLVQPILMGMTNGYNKADALKLVSSRIPKDERGKFVELTSPLIKGLYDQKWGYLILVTIYNIPSDQRTDLIELAAPLLKKIRQGIHRAAVILILDSISPENRETCLRKFSECHATKGLTDITLNETVLELLSNESVRVNCHRYLEGRLESTKDQEQVKMLTTRVLEFTEMLYLHEEHPLYQTAIEIRASTADPGDRKNPYTLQKYLQEKMKEELSFTPPQFTVGEEKLSFDLTTFQKKVSLKTFSRENLPDVKPDALEQLVSDLDEHLNRLKAEDKKKALDQIEQMTGVTLEGLKTGSLESNYLRALLSSTAGPIGLTAAQFFSIVKYIQSKSSEVEDGQLLSPREEALLKIAASITYCTTGKKEGIFNVYHTFLPDAYKLKMAMPKTERESHESSRVTEFVFNNVVQKKLSQQFSGTNKLMQELVGKRVVRQASHQALYLKNLIGHLVGLFHSLTFDRHGGIVYDSLLDKSPVEILKIFYQHFTPQVVIAALQEEVKRTLSSKDMSLFNDINAFLTDRDMGKVWDLDGKSNPLGLTPFAALELLKECGYIQIAK